MKFDNAYMLHLRKHVGRFENMKAFLDKYNIKTINGIDHIKYDNGYQLTNCSVNKGTIANNKGMIQILNLHQKTKNEDDFLIIFEDDILPHKEFNQYYDKVIDYLRENTWNVFYFGVSSRPTYTEIGKIGDFKIVQNKLSCSGAFAVAIHNSVIGFLIDTINENITKPFDVYGLKAVLEKYNKTYSIQPPLVITDVSSSSIRGYRDQNKFNKFLRWNDKLYSSPKYVIPLIIISTGNLHKLDNILELISTLKPLVEPVIIHTSEITRYRKYYKNAIKILSASSSGEIINLIKQFKYTFYGIIHENVNWKQPLPDNFFDIILDTVNDTTDIVAKIKTCGLCYDEDKTLNLTFKNIFVFTKDITKKNRKIMKIPGEYYDNSKCKLYDERKKFHSISKYELKEYIESDKDISFDVFLLFEKWIDNYLKIAREKFNKKPSKQMLKMVYLELSDKEIMFSFKSVFAIFGSTVKEVVKTKYGDDWCIKA